jgi:hypothetical protein
MSTPTVIQACAALYGVVPGASFVSTINDEIANVFSGDEDALLNHYYELVWTDFNNPPLTTNDVAARIVANLGITGDDAATETTRIAGEIDAVPMPGRGAAVKGIIEAFEASGSEAATAFVSLKTALVTAVADPNYQGIVGKNVVFSSLNALQIAEATEESINEVALSLGDTAWAGTAGRDYFTGTTSGLSSQRTLDPKADIDGGDGVDTLSITLNGNHEFTTDSGSMTNVENVKLINGGVIAREFSAKNTTGIESFSLDATAGRISLTNLPAAGISISVSNHVTGDLSLAFASTAISGSSDSLDLTVANVGTGSAVSAVLIDGIETLNLTSNGAAYTNKLDLNNTDNDVKTLNVSGDAKGLTLTLGSTTTTVDASGSSGTLTLASVGSAVTSITGAQGVNSVTSTSTSGTLATLIGGDANDTFSLNTMTASAVATIDGAGGTDSLTLAGPANPVRYSMTGIETLIFANTGAFTFDGSQTEGIQTIRIADDATANVTLAAMADTDFTIDLEGANASSSAKVSTSNTGALAVSASKLATATSFAANKYGVTASKASSLDMVVGDGIEYGGAIVASEATSVSISVPTATISSTGLGSALTISAPKAEVVSVSSAGSFNGAITAEVATQIDLTASSSTATGAATVTAVKAEVLNLTSAEDFTITAGTNGLDKVQVFKLTNTKGVQTVPALAAVATFNASGTGTSSTDADKSQLKMGNLGSTTLDYPIDVIISGFKGGVGATFSGIDAQTGATISSAAGVSVDVGSTTGEVLFGTITGGNSIVFDADGATGQVQAPTLDATTVTVNAKTVGASSNIGSTISANTVSYIAPSNAATTVAVTAKGATMSVNFTGSLKSDVLTVNGGTTATSITVSGNLDLQSATDDGDIVYVDASSAPTTSNTLIDLSGLSGAEQVMVATNSSSAKDYTIKGSASNDLIVVANTGATIVTGNAGADTFVFTAGSLTSGADNATAGKIDIGSATALDRITDFTASQGDLLVMDGVNLTEVTLADSAATAVIPTTDNTATLVRGSLSGTEFTYSSSGADVLALIKDTSAVKAVLLEGAGSSLTDSTVSEGGIVIVGADSMGINYGAAASVTGILGNA